MFAHFTLPNIHDVSRRTVADVMIVGVAALVAGVSFGEALFGLGVCIGLGLGTVNFQMIGSSVVKVGLSDAENKKRPLAMNTLGRMAIITLIAFGLLWLDHKLGFGVLVGLALFQLVMIVNVARSAAHAGPMTSVDDVITANVVERPADADADADTDTDTDSGDAARSGRHTDDHPDGA